MCPGDPQRRGLAEFETRGRRPGPGVPAFPFSCVLRTGRSGEEVWTDGSRRLSRWMCGRVLRQHVHTSSHPSPQEAGIGIIPLAVVPRGISDHQPLHDSIGEARLERNGGIALRVHAGWPRSLVRHSSAESREVTYRLLGATKNDDDIRSEAPEAIFRKQGPR